MNKLSLITLGLVLFVAFPVSAAPFLVCDPYEAADRVDKFEVKIVKIEKKDSSGEVIHKKEVVHKDEHPPDPSGLYGLKLDLGPLNLTDGDYVATAKAYNEFGWSKGTSHPFSLPHN